MATYVIERRPSKNHDEGMKFDHKHIVKDLKFGVIKGNDSIFEQEHGIPHLIIEISGNGYLLDFDQISREVKLYINENFVRKVTSLKELHELVDIIKFKPEKAKDTIAKNMLAIIKLAYSDISIPALMDMEKDTNKMVERLNINK